MRYRIHPKTGDKISELGYGSSYMPEADEESAVEALEAAAEGGINYFDMATADGNCFPWYGKALEGRRKEIFYQIHFGADYTRGSYGWTLKLDQAKRSVEGVMKSLRTDYIDYGMIHCMDEDSDWETYQKNGVLKYLLQMKEQGVVRHIGLSSHTPEVIERILDEAPVETLMFSINPGYDYQQGEYANGSVDARAEVYRRCEREKIGITVMKPFSGGQMLNAKLSPFGVALTPWQCMQYALDRPGVLSVLPGMSSKTQVENLLGFFDATDEERDYSAIGAFKPREAKGKCVYCNHCQPCPAGIDIGLVNKYYDLAKSGDSMAADHYRKLDMKAGACVGCGHCTARCPFEVEQQNRMKEIAEYFGE